jgi:hypothetical protein
VFCPAPASVTADKDEARNPQRFIHVTVGHNKRKRLAIIERSEKMIDKETGEFNINDILVINKSTKVDYFNDFPDSKQNRNKDNCSVSLDNLILNKFKIQLHVNFHKERLRNLYIFIDENEFKNLYNITDSGIDYKDYLENYITFKKSVVDNYMTELIGGKKRRFVWGTLNLLVHPYDYVTFIEIRYY